MDFFEYMKILIKMGGTRNINMEEMRNNIEKGVYEIYELFYQKELRTNNLYGLNH